MRTLLNFLLKYSTWLVFAFYVILSCILLFKNNSYQQSVYLTSANAVSSSLYGMRSDVTSYIGLKKTNSDLQERNAALQNQVLTLQQELTKYKGLAADTAVDFTSDRFDYIMGSVLVNSTRHPRNFFTIDKGYKDGVHPGMGVVDHNGIVGIVNVTGAHTARIISVLNENQHFSVKLKGTPYVGSLTWRGPDPTVAYVEEIPKHVKFRVGTHIVTTGYSTTFPEGLPVGTIIGQVRGKDDNYFTLKIKLASDFQSLSTVRVIKDRFKKELDTLATYDDRPTSKENKKK